MEILDRITFFEVIMSNNLNIQGALLISNSSIINEWSSIREAINEYIYLFFQKEIFTGMHYQINTPQLKLINSIRKTLIDFQFI